MSTVTYILAILFILLTILHGRAVEEQTDHSDTPNLYLEDNIRHPTWPSFSNNNNSYISFLGIFLEQRMTRHLQTAAEPALFRVAILLAQELNITINGKQIAYRVEETSGRDVIEIIDRACRSISENRILGIVGPEYSLEARILAGFCNRSGLPLIGYSTTEPDLSNRNMYPTFYRLPPSEIMTARALLKLFQKYNWNSTNVIYQGDTYGQGGFQALTEVFGDEVKISRSIRFDPFTNSPAMIRRQLEESPSRIVIVMANADVTTKIIHLAQIAGDILAPSFLWIMTASNSTMDILNYKHVNQMTGMLILRLVSPETFHIATNTSLLHAALDVWKKYDPHSFEDGVPYMDVFALYAFDAAWLLILAFQQLCQKNATHCLTLENASNCFNSSFSVRNELHEILQTMSFIGLTGRVQFGSNSTDRIDGTGAHYAIDNLQPSGNGYHLVPVMILNATMLNMTRGSATEWTSTGNPIRWPRAWDEVPKDYALLKGKRLNITVYSSPPFFMQSSSPNSHGEYVYAGYIHELIMLLKERMGFDFTYIVASNGTTYDELVDCVQNRTCDVVFADLTITRTRLDKVDFSVPIHSNSMRLVVRKSQQKTMDQLAFLKPFSFDVWLMIIGIIYIPSVLLIVLYERGEERSGIHSNRRGGSFGRSLFHSIGALLQRGSELQVATICGRSQTVIVWLMSVILVSLYTSYLVVNFTAELEKPWLESIYDLDMCHRVPCNRIGVLEHSQHEEYFTRQVTHDIPMNYYRLKHPKEAFMKLSDGLIDVALVDSPTAEYMTQKEYCQLELAGMPFAEADLGLALPKQWPYAQDLDVHILELRINGILQQRYEAYLQEKSCDVRSDYESGKQKGGLTVLTTSGLFILYGSCTGLTLIIYLLQRLCRWCNAEKSSDTTRREEGTSKDASQIPDTNHSPHSQNVETRSNHSGTSPSSHSYTEGTKL